MRKFSDESGWVRAAVCFAALLTHHGLRDSLITALPTLAAADAPSPSEPPTATPTDFPDSSPSSNFSYPDTQGHGDFAGLYGVEGSVHAPKSANVTLSTSRPANTVFGKGKQSEGKPQKRDSGAATNPPPVFYSLAGTEAKFSGAVETTRPSPSSVFSPTGLDEAREKSGAKREERYQSGVPSFPQSFPSLGRRRKTDESNSEAGYEVSKVGRKDESVISRPLLYVLRGGRDASLPLERLKTEGTTRRRERSIGFHLTEAYDHNAVDDLIRIGHGHIQGKNRKLTIITAEEEDSAFDLRHDGAGDAEEDQEEEEEEEEKAEVYRTVRVSSVEGHYFKEEWSLVMEGLVLSSVFWGWLVAALLADTLMDRAGAVLVLALSEGVAGLLGLLTHAVSLGGPWALLGVRVVQGVVQGVSYPAVVRVLEGVPSSGRASMAVLVYLGPSLGTGLGAGLGCLTEWYAASYVMGSLAVVLTPLCLLLPPPPEKTPHKEMQWKKVLSCRGVWACVGVHLANTWMLHTLLLGLPFCLTYTHLDQPAAGGWVVAVAVVAVGVAVRVALFLASKLSKKRPFTALTRRRAPVFSGTVMLVAAVITMATAGLDSAEVLVGVGVGLAGLGVGVVRTGYRLNVDDMAPLGVWRVTRVLDAAAVVVAAACPLAVCGLAQVGDSGWVWVWLVPLFALVPSAVVYVFLLTSNQQPWDQKGESNGGVANGVAGGGVPVSPVNGVGPAFSVGRQSFKSARSALTFKTAQSRTRSRTVSCRTVDDDLEGDMHSAVGTNSVECRSVVEEGDPECVSVASSSTFKSDGADMHSVVDGADGAGAPGKHKPGQQFGSMLVNGGTTDRTSAWLSSHHDLVLEAEQTPTRAGTHAANAIYALLW